jgi:hypothetical protein
VKRFYKLTNKVKFTEGIARQQRRERLLRKMSQHDPSRTAKPRIDDLPPTNPETRYHMSTQTKSYNDLHAWLDERSNDAAFDVSTESWPSFSYHLSCIQNFIPVLKDHLLGRIKGMSYEGDENGFTAADRSSVHFTKNRIYHHQTVRINYTTYDLRRDQDSVNTRGHADIMVLSHEEDTAD